MKVFDAKRGEYRKLEAFASSILEERAVSPDAREGLADQKVLMAIHASAQSGKRMEIV